MLKPSLFALALAGSLCLGLRGAGAQENAASSGFVLGREQKITMLRGICEKNILSNQTLMSNMLRVGMSMQTYCGCFSTDFGDALSNDDIMHLVTTGSWPSGVDRVYQLVANQCLSKAVGLR